jgi:hypothetical protein
MKLQRLKELGGDQMGGSRNKCALAIPEQKYGT